ncbi:restriction endonuclease subunit S [Mycoplasma capricolum]|uniref:restriction endonuclease subunit S n=1 Tax=Mycoplasma capricolum TaxID=2095 RepID=UPI003DA5C4A6
MKQNELFPKIRFKEFTNAWEQWKLSNIVQYKSSSMTSKDLIPYGKYDVYDPNRIAGKTNESPVEKEYISVVKDGDAGRIRLLPKNTMILSTMGALLASEGSNIEFIYFLLSNKNDLAKERNGSIIPHIYFRDYGENLYNIPKSNEQSKISSLFSNLDSLITLHQRKLILLKNTKNRLLEKMFCDEKSEFPSIRFKEFTNAWEQEKLENCSNFINGLTRITKNNFSYGKDLYIDYLNVFNNIFVDQKLLKTYNNTKNQNYIRYKDVLLTVSSETPEEVAMSSLISWKPNKNIAFNSFCICIRFANKEQFDAKYLGYLFRSKSFRKQAEKMAQGISRFNINQTILKKAKIYYPLKIEEQEKIGKSFYTLDSLITLHQWECNFWKFRNFVFDFLKFSTRFFKKIQKYTHTWEQEKLGNIGVFKSSNVDKLIRNNEESINLINYMDVYNKLIITSKNSKSLMKVTASKKQIIECSVLKKDVLFTPTSETADDIAHSKVIEETLSNTLFSYHLMRYRPNQNVFDTLFPDYLFDTNYFKKQATLLAKGVQRFVLGKPEFESIQVKFPNINEQSKISKTFRYIDSLITLHQRKLELLKNIKNTLLEKMFL